jgi:hypothetical protein
MRLEALNITSTITSTTSRTPASYTIHIITIEPAQQVLLGARFTQGEREAAIAFV